MPTTAKVDYAVNFTWPNVTAGHQNTNFSDLAVYDSYGVRKAIYFNGIQTDGQLNLAVRTDTNATLYAYYGNTYDLTIENTEQDCNSVYQFCSISQGSGALNSTLWGTITADTYVSGGKTYLGSPLNTKGMKSTKTFGAGTSITTEGVIISTTTNFASCDFGMATDITLFTNNYCFNFWNGWFYDFFDGNNVQLQAYSAGTPYTLQIIRYANNNTGHYYINGVFKKEIAGASTAAVPIVMEVDYTGKWQNFTRTIVMNESGYAPTITIGAEETNAGTSVTIQSPTASQTIYTTSINLTYNATSLTDPTFNLTIWKDAVFYSLNSSYVNATIITVPMSVYTEGSHNFTVEVKDTASTTNATVSYTVDLYDFSDSISNYTTYNSTNYANTIAYAYSIRCGYTGATATRNVTVNGTYLVSAPVTCDNTTYNYSSSYQHTSNTALNLNISFYTVNGTLHNSTALYYLSDIYAPSVSIGLSSPAYGFRNNFTENVAVSANDTTSPLILCNITLPLTNYSNVPFANNITTYAYNLTDGANVFTSKCWDLVNNTNTTTTTTTIYAKQVLLINEDTGATFSNFAAMSTLKLIDYGYVSTWNFLTANTTSVYYVTDTANSSFRLEKAYVADPTNSTYSIYMNAYLMEYLNRLCVPNYQYFYGITFYSSTKKPVWIKNNYADCYIAEDYTHLAYQDALLLPATSINAIYYLYTLDGANKVFLSSLDGSIASSIALDVLIFQRTSYNFGLTQSDFSISKLSNGTIYIFYSNQNGDNTRVQIDITNSTGSNLFSHTETTNPNQFALYFNSVTLNTTSSDIYKLTIIRTKTDGTQETLYRLFSMNGTSGLTTPSIAIVLAVLTLLFLLTFVATPYVFSFFGIIALLISLAITTLAPISPALLLIQAVVVILLVYVGLTYRNAYGGIT
jgi:hypothetical protein